MGRTRKFTLLRAVAAIFSLKIYPIKEKLLDFEKKLDKLLYYFTPRCYLTTTFSKRSIILSYSNTNQVNPSLESATEFATVWRL